ncbi:hypothetical protein J5N97_021887 [Dioscorea zingiberensis]|uniref:cytokinin dehydrogenase n=1 Tax=Dioscorea zingiberensis TaxID=325984 RepID=A0A9D5CAU8_9LILI|nr:hypothetical protein J5N97_021887 [Dioscorea zingiberensis]
MEFALFCTRMNVVILLLALCSPCKFIQSPMEFGPLNFLKTSSRASVDFGRISFKTPSAVLRPESSGDISHLLSFLSASSSSKVTVAARGAGHSIHGQAQAQDGIVIEMDSLPSSIDIHKEKNGSWTDYLYLSIGGTLSNGGISGQTFKHGPQISNVLQLDVVTGKGELVTCSPTKNSELFNAVLGGLGQFGIITRARILLQDAPEKVKWVRAFYDDFQTFMADQELLVSMPEKVDYVEGFIVLNEQSLHSSSIAFPANLHNLIPHLQSAPPSKLHYCLEFAIHEYSYTNVEQVVEEISKKLSYMPAQMYSVEVSYFDFLNRVRLEEMSLRERNMWEVPHPWLNMFVPKHGITEFKDLLLETIPAENFEGPVLIYPLLRDKWDTNTSAVLPESDTGEKVVYVVGVLRSANPATCSTKCLNEILHSHEHFAQSAAEERIGALQYLAHHPSPAHWRRHFGRRWDLFAARKARFDPLCVLSPGQGIFSRASRHQSIED